MAIAPMANVTDAAFRRLFAKYGKPDVTWTEFVSVEGLLSKGRDKLLPDFWYTEAERPIVAQIFGAKPEQFAPVAELIRELGFDGIDINMGCPDRAVEKQGAGAALMKDPERAKAIIKETKRGAGGLPVSVKTRIGYDRNTLAEWLPHLLEADPAAITLHLRTRQEMSDVPAQWEAAREAAGIRDRHGFNVPILGNGDVASLAEAKEKAATYGIDGAMIGRGIFGAPWFFSGKEPDLRERLRIMVEHTELFEQMFIKGDVSAVSATNYPLKNFDVMKKHYKAYCHGFDGAKELRIQLMEAGDAAEVRAITDKFMAEVKIKT